MEEVDSPRTVAEAVADSVQGDGQEEEAQEVGSDLHHPAQRTLLWSDTARESSDSAAAVPSFLGPFDVSQFYTTGRFSDLSIVCADGGIVRAHQVVLGATSSFAQRILIRFINLFVGPGFTSWVNLVLFLRTQKFLPVESDVTIVMPDFTRCEVDALMKILYGQDQLNDEDGVSEDLLKALGCSYEVSQLTRAEGGFYFDSRVSSLLEKAVCDWDTRDDLDRFLCPEENCSYAHIMRKRVRNHLGAVHRKMVCPQCGDVINRKEMESHFVGKHALKGEVKVEVNVEAIKSDGDDSENNERVPSVKTKDEDGAWTKESEEDEDYAPPKKRTKKGRKSNAGGGENPGKITCAYCNKKVTAKQRSVVKFHG